MFDVNCINQIEPTITRFDVQRWVSQSDKDYKRNLKNNIK